MGADEDSVGFLVKIDFGGLFLLGKPCSHRLILSTALLRNRGVFRGFSTDLQAFERMMQDTGKYHHREDSEDRPRKCPKKKQSPRKRMMSTMPVFRVEKNSNYTTMCNYHLRYHGTMEVVPMINRPLCKEKSDS